MHIRFDGPPFLLIYERETDEKLYVVYEKGMFFAINNWISTAAFSRIFLVVLRGVEKKSGYIVVVYLYTLFLCWTMTVTGNNIKVSCTYESATPVEYIINGRII